MFWNFGTFRKAFLLGGYKIKTFSTFAFRFCHTQFRRTFSLSYNLLVNNETISWGRRRRGRRDVLRKVPYWRICLSVKVQGGSNMTGTNCDLFTHNQSRSYLNHLVPCYEDVWETGLWTAARGMGGGARSASCGHLTPGEGTTRWALGKKAGWTANAEGDSKGNISCFCYEFWDRTLAHNLT